LSYREGPEKEGCPSSENEDEYGKKLCQWTDKQMRHAMEAVLIGELGVNRSALQHGVPRTTELLVEFSTVPSPDQSPTLMLKKKIWLIFCLNVQEWKKEESKQIKLQRQETQRKKQEDRAAKQAEWQKAIEEEESEEAKSEA